MPDPPNTPLSLSDKTPKQQRLDRTKAILRSHPNLTRSEIVGVIAQELQVDRATAYSYLRELKELLYKGA
jgi:hypothetical protein